MPLDDRRDARAAASARSPSTTSGQLPAGDALVQPRARRVARATPSSAVEPRRARDAARRRSRTSFQGTAQAFQSSLQRPRAAARCSRSSSSTSCSASSTRASSTRSRSSRGCRPPASARSLTLLLFRQRPQPLRLRRHHHAGRHREEERDHDDRLRARRRSAREGRAPRDAIYEGCLVRFRPIMMTTMAALHRHAADRARLRRRRRGAPAARPRRRRRAALLAAADALHDAGLLHLHGVAAGLAAPAPGPAPQREAVETAA